MEFTNNKYLVYVDKNDLLSDRVMSTKGYEIMKILNNQTYNQTTNLKTLKSNIEVIFNNKIFNCKYISK